MAPGLKTRIASAVVLIPIVLTALYLGGPVWIVGITALAALGGREMEAMAVHANLRPMRGLAPVGAAGVVAGAGFFGSGAALLVLAAAIMVAFADQLRRSEAERSVADWAVGVAATAYVGVLLAYLAILRGLQDGLGWSVLLMVLVWANDSAAYAGGRIWGRTPFAPTISPKKTWEGFAAGMVASVVAGVLFVGTSAFASPPRFFPPDSRPAEPYPVLVVIGGLGVLVAIAGPLGDLAKSFIKRQAGVKDAGHLIPGHGGVLDRLDSLMFAAPVVYAVATLLGPR